MPRQASGNFNQKEYIKAWKKDNMKALRISYNKDFVESFKLACSKLGLVQSQVIKKAMQEVIDKAGL